jgi:hypothetical protein
MILLQINSKGSRSIPFERDAPRAVHVDAVADWLSPERMQTEAWKIEVLQIVRCFQSVQHVSTSLGQSGIDLRAMSGFLQLPESLVPETLNHVLNVTRCASSVKCNGTPTLDVQRHLSLLSWHLVKRASKDVVRPEGFEPPTLRSEV